MHEFEQVVQYLRVTCQRLIDSDTKEKSLVAIVLHHKSMTAKPLLDIAVALYAEVLKSGKHQGMDMKTIKLILKQVDCRFFRNCKASAMTSFTTPGLRVGQLAQLNRYFK